MPSTSTPLTRLPISSRSRSRRTTSTSGSSGIVALPGGARGKRRLVLHSRFVLQPLPGGTSGGLFGLLLGTALALAVGRAAQRDRREEVLGVVRALGAHLVARQLVEAPGRDLLEPRLVVVP